MSAGEKAFGLIKSFLLITERFDALEARIKRVADDQTDLGRSHVELAQRVARLEGFLEGAVAATGREPRLPRE